MRSASENFRTPRKLNGGVIGFSGIMAAVRQFFFQDAMGLHYAVRILVGTTFVWLMLRKVGDADPLWAVISLIVVTEPRIEAAWLAFHPGSSTRRSIA
jgi:uncharacterized membrane protein YccC